MSRQHFGGLTLIEGGLADDSYTGGKPAKYRNKPTVIEGIRFDSRAESRRYEQLKMLEKAGTITNLRRQPKFLIQPGFTDWEGKRQQAIHYKGDFAYTEQMSTGFWVEVVEDVKGVETEAFKLKWKMVKYQNPSIEFRIVKM